MRHGMTAEDSPTCKKISGWNGVSLNEEGRIKAARTARKLKELGVTSITSSDTKRVMQTAGIVSKALGLPVVPSEKLRSWNMGSLQGMLKDSAQPFLDFFQKNPDIAVPKGEKFQAFYSRFKGAFNSLVAYSRKFPEAKPAIFTHSQDIDLIPWFIAGKEPGGKLESLGIEPADILEVSVEGDKITYRRLRG